eukprot:TRINITY_DN3320_c0_g1_i2.p1 TRINITY_DN3320_c0_g1~~TRINITY_DN3320_c0_g1_i2.p1  ORF type:complete len:276 (-),score=30.63 TRINITY_DN3320_c0_g1_i2:63-890(-)
MNSELFQWAEYNQYDKFQGKQQSELECKDEDENYLIHIAASRNATETVKLLLDKGLDIDSKNAKGETALHRAVQSNSENSAILLINYGASLDIKDKQGKKWKSYGSESLVSKLKGVVETVKKSKKNSKEKVTARNSHSNTLLVNVNTPEPKYSMTSSSSSSLSTSNSSSFEVGEKLHPKGSPTTRDKRTRRNSDLPNKPHKPSTSTRHTVIKDRKSTKLHATSTEDLVDITSAVASIISEVDQVYVEPGSDQITANLSSGGKSYLIVETNKHRQP